jgi:hypothetical protein
VPGAQRYVADHHRGVGLDQHLAQIGRAAEVLGGDAVPVGQQHLGQQHPGPGGRPEGDPPAVEPSWVHGGHQVDRQHRSVATDREVGQEQQLIGVAQVLHQGDGSDVEFARGQGGVELIRGVLVQVHSEQGAGAHQPPVNR